MYEDDFKAEEVELQMFAVFYVDGDSTDYAMFCAEDEDHARDMFAERYPDETIIDVACHGSAF